MPSPSVSHTFTNSTTADATQVNTNFTDIINSLTDGSKDFSISALTCAGNVTFNGNTTVGNASSDDFTLTASLASSIPIKTHNTYDIGSVTSKGLRAIYFASSSATNTAKLQGPAISSDITLTLPAITGALEVTKDKSYEITNLSVACSVAANALTIAVKDKSGSDASASSPIYIGMRNATAATGTYLQRSVTAALSTVISSGSTAGHTSAKDHYLYVYALDNAGTVELAWSSKVFDEGTLQTTTAEGGAGAADSLTTLYSTTARTSVPIRLIARLKSNQTTAGTWAAVPTEVSLLPAKIGPHRTVQVFTSGSGTYTKPEGVQLIRVRIVGGGGGGQGSGTSPGAGGTGGNTTFGSLTGNGGVGGGTSTGGTASGGDINLSGSNGIGRPNNGASNYGGAGGPSAFGGAGHGGDNAPTAGYAGKTNTGGGGGGAGNGATGLCGSGGGAGGYSEAIIANPSSTYSYAVGAAGTAGTVGSSGAAGGAGGSGIVIVEEY